MNVNEFRDQITSKELNRQLNAVYRWQLNLSTMTESAAEQTLAQFNRKIHTIKSSSLSHQSQRNPKFMEAVMVTKVLESWISERKTALMEAEMKKTEIRNTEKYVKGLISKHGVFETRYPGRGKAVMYATAANMAKTRTMDEAMEVLRGVLYGSKQLMESEVDQASAIVAARGLVDEIQKMLESIGAMINEELPALHDTIRDRVGQEQAESFGAAANSALTPLMDAVKAAREAMDGAARIVAGESPTPMSTGSASAPMKIPNAAADLDAAAAADAPPEPPEDSELDSADVAAGGTAELGRGKRF